MRTSFSFFLSFLAIIFFGHFFHLIFFDPESRVHGPLQILDYAGAVNHRKHVQFRSRVQLNCLIKVEVYLLLEFPVGRVRTRQKLR